MSMSDHVEDTIKATSALFRGVMDEPPWRNFVQEFREIHEADFCGLMLQKDGADDRPYVVVDDPRGGFGLDALARCRGSHNDLINAECDIAITEGEYIDKNRGEKANKIVFKNLNAAIKIGGNELWNCFFCVARNTKRGGLSSIVLSAIQTIGRDLGPAVKLYLELERSRTQRVVLQSAMDKLGIGAIFLNRQFRIVDINHEALMVINNVESITIRNGAIYIQDLDRRTEFDSQLNNAVAGGPILFNHGLVSIDNDNGEKLDILILPIANKHNGISDMSPAVVIYMQSLSIRQKIPITLISDIFGLSYVEAHLALLISQGYTLETAAEAIGIKISTARSYSKNIYSKLGISRQVDLVRKILRSVALLA
tara:strand:- start:2641 stop:3744 length:1104 start_codon:yes stop_codon:yes gene_type:complete